MRYFKAILQFLVVVVVLDRLIFWALASIAGQSEYGASGGQINYYLRNTSKFDTLILGASRPLRGIDPGRLPGRAYNLSNSGLDASYAVCLLTYLIEQGAAPKVVVVDFNPNELRSAPKGYQYLRPYYGRSQLVTEYFNRWAPDEKLRILAFQSYRYNTMVPSILNNALASARGVRSVTGYFPDPVTPGDAQRTMLTRRSESFEIPDSTTTSIHMAILEDLVRICKNGNIRLVLISTPCFGSRGHVMPTCLQRFSRDHPGLYWDYFYAAPPAFDDPNLWHDAQHFNRKGAEMFSDLLALDMERK